MAYKAGEGTLQRLSNTNSHPKHFLPLYTTSMSAMLPWNPFLVCEIEVSPNGGPGFCCGMTKKGAPCKNSIKLEDTKIGHQKLNALTRERFELSNLQSKLCGVARDFLCARWHRQRQVDQVGRQWYEAAVRNQARVPHDSRIASPSIVHPGQRQTSSASRRRPPSDNTDRSPTHGLRQDSPVPLSTSSESVQSINPFVTAEMLRTNSVPWHVSPARPAILTSVTNIWAGVQDLTLRSLSLSEELENIDCVFCLTEDEEQANECVILRCDQCRAHCHLSCAEEWLERRDTGFGTSCCVCRNEGSLAALIRPLRDPLADAETDSVHSASESSTEREPVTIRYSAQHEPRQSQPRQGPVESPGVSVEQSGPRRSARLRGAHLPRDSSTSAPLRRSVGIRKEYDYS
ncbi:unnamed protein product [Penicillium salamii]|nr:unnamed protein product [Penicillium salamii]CAG8044498.1 unnamed protein product [Penicillium salamii]